MYVLNQITGEKQAATITKIDASEISQINKTKRFDFNWNKEKNFHVYKLTAEDKEEPIGLLSVEERPKDYALEIRLLAVSRENVGKSKEYSRIAGCLIAFVCREAFKRGFEGFVCLKPKTRLEKHYIQLYGLQSTKIYLITEGENSLQLIQEYYEDK
ncbi:GNAT family N-acetyltransferase [Chryseobacterium timonianum]|uniref:GNAT family N-acetyltransferase n=1 Tax=Chryseobacterium timonianum TaxID=1805473 RepID=UPI00083ACA79|nr:GNAT family N-acetyltransferase [Chryseobacterium timonianum]